MCAVHNNRTGTTACMSKGTGWPKHLCSLPNLAQMYVSDMVIMYEFVNSVVCRVSLRFRLI